MKNWYRVKLTRVIIQNKVQSSCSFQTRACSQCAYTLWVVCPLSFYLLQMERSHHFVLAMLCCQAESVYIPVLNLINNLPRQGNSIKSDWNGHTSSIRLLNLAAAYFTPWVNVYVVMKAWAEVLLACHSIRACACLCQPHLWLQCLSIFCTVIFNLFLCIFVWIVLFAY